MADCLACLHFHEMRYDPQDIDWLGRDRRCSTGHYSIAMYKMEAGILPRRGIAELRTWNGSRLPMSTSTRRRASKWSDRSPWPRPGGRCAMGLRLDGSDARLLRILRMANCRRARPGKLPRALRRSKCDNLVALDRLQRIQADRAR